MIRPMSDAPVNSGQIAWIEDRVREGFTVVYAAIKSGYRFKVLSESEYIRLGPFMRRDKVNTFYVELGLDAPGRTVHLANEKDYQAFLDSFE